MQHDLAFALAGLGGFNSHGAGFLTAADEAGVVPDLVTATSGQIFVVAKWLANQDLRAALVNPVGENNPFAQLSLAVLGMRGVFRPAYENAFWRFFQLPERGDGPFDIFADRFFPAQEFIPTRTDAELSEIVETLNGGCKNGASVGVVFNTYDPFTGRGFLYGNDRARALLAENKPLPRKPTSPNALYNRGETETEILPITLESLQSALWLSLYGFDGLPKGQMDGAYHRSCIVSELHNFSTIFVARPLANGWIRAERPRNWFDVQDWQSEMWFSVGYKAEVESMKRINKLIENGHLTDPNFTYIDLKEIEPITPAGFFNFFTERDKVFDAARDASAPIFADYKSKRIAAAIPEAEPLRRVSLRDARSSASSPHADRTRQP